MLTNIGNILSPRSKTLSNTEKQMHFERHEHTGKKLEFVKLSAYAFNMRFPIISQFPIWNATSLGFLEPTLICYGFRREFISSIKIDFC